MTITHLYLYNNQISDAGAKGLGENLVYNTTITHICIAGNQISDSGVAHLAKCLILNTSITELYLDNNQISDARAEALVKCLEHNSVKTLNLHLHNNQISYKGINLLKISWQSNGGSLSLYGQNPAAKASEKATNKDYYNYNERKFDDIECNSIMGENDEFGINYD